MVSEIVVKDIRSQSDPRKRKMATNKLTCPETQLHSPAGAYRQYFLWRTILHEQCGTSRFRHLLILLHHSIKRDPMVARLTTSFRAASCNPVPPSKKPRPAGHRRCASCAPKSSARDDGAHHSTLLSKGVEDLTCTPIAQPGLGVPWDQESLGFPYARSIPVIFYHASSRFVCFVCRVAWGAQESLDFPFARFIYHAPSRCVAWGAQESLGGNTKRTLIPGCFPHGLNSEESPNDRPGEPCPFRMKDGEPCPFRMKEGSAPTARLEEAPKPQPQTPRPHTRLWPWTVDWSVDSPRGVVLAVFSNLNFEFDGALLLWVGYARLRPISFRIRIFEFC
ncbi:hypothetical protein PAPYR_10592 [Paratrimastix pyriformis]|uniref:Uncharacterized protein n=1 Tax=Paratrimastix pyriformis TaxID=342808 RepID=A0ABQ8U5M3_9EUKA|nr:hypothetical protein PAPYR_10592 [Paratrimastix pyriformis]